ncbi:MAG: HAMP domain-containing protein [Endomicrobium sp.]|nr:HAMP domain-containing protein [Endomicrobium sp.]
MKSKNSFFLKLFAFFIIVSSLLACVFFGAARLYVKSLTQDFFSHELKRNAAAITPFIAECIEKSNRAALSALVEEAAQNFNNRITLIAPDGAVIADSQNESSSMSNHAGRDEVKAVLEGAPFAVSVRYSSTLGENMLYAAVPVSKNFVLRLSMPLKSVNFLARQTLKNIFIIFLASIAVSFLAIYFISRKPVLGIVSLSAAASKIANGDFKAKAEVLSSDEIGALAVSFNKMSDEIDALFKGINDSKNTLDKVLASVSDGILLTDKNGKIILANGAFQKNFRGAAKGRYVWEFLRDKNFEDALKNASSQELYGEIEIENFGAKNVVFSYTISKIKSENNIVVEDSFVILLKDITKIKQLDNLKKEFVVNASHELKTPVTSIAGFAELLETKNLTKEDARYVEIIKKQSERLTNIVNDLLSLSALESVKEIVQKEIDIANVINDAANFYKKKAAQKGLQIEVFTPENLKKIYANEFNIEQLFINLIDNAVRYTDRGNISIRAKNIDGGFVEISVSDTGIGIPQRCLERIFERFYVADKARSKKSGGTGLGLAIVKHILNANNGSISVESKEGAGSTFTVRLPAII